jgi:hypothetical protein
VLSGPKTSSPSPISPSRGIEIVASSAKVEFRAEAFGPEKRGAGGRGLLGLPPYLDDGVPGLGLPLRSAGSNCRFGGGLLNSEEPLEGVQGLVGEFRPVGEYAVYEVSGAAIVGAVSIIDGARECEEITVGWYDLLGVLRLCVLLCKPSFFNCTSSFDRGDLTGLRSDLLREGPSGILGNS